jgi:hypothetical protein
MDVDEPVAFAVAAAGGAGQPAPMHVDDLNGAGGGGAAAHDADDTVYLASLVGAVFGDPSIASNVLSCLRMDDAVPLRTAGTLTRVAVAAFPWDWRTQCPARPHSITSGLSLGRWRACFGAAVSVDISNYLGSPVTDAHLAPLAGLRDVTLTHCEHVTDAALQPVAKTLTRLHIHSCSFSGAILSTLTDGVITEVDVRRLNGLGGRGVTNADLCKLGHATTVLLDERHDEFDGSGGVSVITDAGFAFLPSVRRLRVTVAGDGEVGISGAGIASLAHLTDLELLLPPDTDVDALLGVLSGLPATVTRLTLQRDNENAWQEDFVVLPISEDDIVTRGLGVPLSRLRYLSCNGLIHTGTLLLYTTSLRTLEIDYCQNVDTANFARLAQLRDLDLSHAEEWDWMNPTTLITLHSLVSLRLYISWPGKAVIERLRSLTFLHNVQFEDICGDVAYQMDVLDAIYGIGPGTVDFEPGDEFEITWTAALPAACPCCGRGTDGCPAWWRAHHPPARAGGGGGGGGWGGDDDDDDADE